MNRDNFMLRIFICFSFQSSLAFRWEKINKNNPMVFVYSHFLIFYEEIFIHKKGKSKALTANLALSQSSFKFWVCINNSSFFLMYKISMLY